MTDKEQYELIGKIVSDYAERDKELKTLRVKAAEIGKSMGSIGSQLEKCPEFLLFSGETADMRFFHRTPLVKKEDLADLDTIINLCNQIRSNIIELERLEQQKKSLGI